MANLAKSNAVWLRFLTRFFFILGIFRVVDFLYRRFGDEKRTILIVKGPTTNFGGVATLDGCHVREDTTEAGEVIVRITGSGPYTVTFYKATGGSAGDRICAGSGAAGNTIALAELNSSGCTGTYKLAGSVTADTSDEMRFFVQQDFRLDATNVFSGTDDDGEDSRSRDAVSAALDELQSLAGQMRTVCVNLLTAFMVGTTNNVRGAGSKFLREKFTTLLSESVTSVNGVVAPVRSGALPSFVLAMEQEATGSTQTFRRRRVAASAGELETGCDGQYEIDAHTPEDQFPTGTVTLELVNGKAEGFPTAAQREQFRVKWTSDEDDREIEFSNLATVGVAWKGDLGFGGALGFTIRRKLTKTGDSGNDILASVASGFTVTGEDLNNTTQGEVTIVLDQDGSNYAVLVYADDTLDTLVAQSAAVAANAPFTANPVNADVTGLTFAGTLGDSPSDGASCTVDFNYGAALNSNGVPDRMKIAVTLTDEGEASRLMARMPIFQGNGFRLNGVASAELVDDDLVKANTYPDTYGTSRAA